MIRMLAGGGHPIVAGFTIRSDTFMGEVVDVPGSGCMAGVALAVGLQVIGMFAGGAYAIVTAGADARGFDRTVIKTDIIPVAGRVMTDIALLGGLDMRRMQSGCLGTVVTA